MTVKDLIKTLLDYPLDYEVLVTVDYSAEKEEETGCKGAGFDILSIDNIWQSVQIKVDDWRERSE